MGAPRTSVAIKVNSQVRVTCLQATAEAPLIICLHGRPDNPVVLVLVAVPVGVTVGLITDGKLDVVMWPDMIRQQEYLISLLFCFV